MNPNFQAEDISVYDVDECLVIGFADKKRLLSTGDYLMLQRAHEFDERDRRLGMADVYLERNSQAWSGYGHIELFELLPDRVRLRFNERGTQAMAGVKEMEVSFNLSPERFKTLREGLGRCFAGFNYYRDRTF